MGRVINDPIVPLSPYVPANKDIMIPLRLVDTSETLALLQIFMVLYMSKLMLKVVARWG